MKKLLNTLFITTEDIYLSDDHDSVVITQKGKKLSQLPLKDLDGIIMFTYVGASPALMGKCAENNIGFTMLTPSGRFLCRVNSSSHGNVLLRKKQYRISESEKESLPYVRDMILGKVYNQRWVIGRTLRDYPMRIEQEPLQHAVEVLNQKMSLIRSAESIDRIRGLEGECASTYFSVLDELILNQKEDFFFHERNRRPPLDNVNALLSFCYMLLANECANALESVGLDSYVGCMHTDKPGRKSLALDLMEELRPCMADRFVLTAINNRIVQASDFEALESGAVLLKDDGRKRILKAWQERKTVKVTHPYLQEKLSWGMVPYAQSLLLARTLRGDLDGYPPFLWK